MIVISRTQFNYTFVSNNKFTIIYEIQRKPKYVIIHTSILYYCRSNYNISFSVCIQQSFTHSKTKYMFSLVITYLPLPYQPNWLIAHKRALYSPYHNYKHNTSKGITFPRNWTWHTWLTITSSDEQVNTNVRIFYLLPQSGECNLFIAHNKRMEVVRWCGELWVVSCPNVRLYVIYVYNRICVQDCMWKCIIIFDVTCHWTLRINF